MVSMLIEEFDLATYLDGKGGHDLDPDDLKYIFEHFVTEKTSEERHQIMMDGLEKQTAALEMVAGIDKRVCIIEEDKDRKRKLLPVKIAGIGIGLTIITNLPTIASILKSLAK